MSWDVSKRLRKLWPDKPPCELYPVHQECFTHKHARVRCTTIPPTKMRLPSEQKCNEYASSLKKLLMTLGSMCCCQLVVVVSSHACSAQQAPSCNRGIWCSNTPWPNRLWHCVTSWLLHPPREQSKISLMVALSNGHHIRHGCAIYTSQRQGFSASQKHVAAELSSSWWSPTWNYAQCFNAADAK